MNVPENFKSELISQFKSEKKIKEAFDNFELFKFDSLNISQMQKLYLVQNQKIFNEVNSKKHLQKVFEMIKTNFYNDKTDAYLNLFFLPTNSVIEIKKRREIISSILEISTIFENEDKTLKQHISKLNSFDSKVSFSKSIYTLEKNTSKYLYENYFLNIIEITRKDLEEMQNTSEDDFMILSEEHLHIENDQYTLKEFEKVIEGYLIKKNKTLILSLIEIYLIVSKILEQLKTSVEKLTNKNYEFNLNLENLKLALEKDNSIVLKELSRKASNLKIEVEKINHELKDKISSKKVSLEGSELLELLNSGNIQQLANKLKQETSEFVRNKEKELLEEFKKNKIAINYIFESHNYPLKIDDTILEELNSKIEQKISSFEYESYMNLGKFSLNQINIMQNGVFFLDLFMGISKFSKKYSLEFANISKKYLLNDAKNIYIEKALGISYGLGTLKIKNEILNGEKITVLTGANSGGKTTLLEMFLQAQILTTLGLGISASNESEIVLVDEVIYLKKFTGTQGSGAFEQTIRNLIEILDSNSSKLILIDEFEAITEPGAAAKILIGFLEELSKQNNFCIAVSHLGADIKEFIEQNNVKSIRIDGISASGLDDRGNLITNHQPQFNTLGKSTPELILRRVLKDENFWKGKNEKTKKLLETILN